MVWKYKSYMKKFTRGIQLFIGEGKDYRNASEEDSINLIMKVSTDLIHDTDERIEQLESIRLKSRYSIGYEVGYLTKVIQEMYRKQVDKYNVSNYMYVRLYLAELVLYLEEIEHHYWEIEHLTSIIHEIERKYGMRDGIGGDYVDFKPDDFTEATKRTRFTIRNQRKRKMKKPKKWNNFWKDALDRLTSTPTKKSRWWWPLEYGWEIDYYW